MVGFISPLKQNLEMKNNEGKTPLDIAEQYGISKVAQYIKKITKKIEDKEKRLNEEAKAKVKNTKKRKLN